MKSQTLPIHPTRRRVPCIEVDTPILPDAVMDAVRIETGLWLGQPLPREWVTELAAHANATYAHDPDFRRRIRARGDMGRDYLYMFARYWLARLLAERHPQLHQQLPASFCGGSPLPPRRMEVIHNIPPPTRRSRRPRFARPYIIPAGAHLLFP